MNLQEFKNAKVSIQLEFKRELDNEALYELAKGRVDDDYETSIDDWKEFVSYNLSEVYPDLIGEIVESITIKIE